MKKKLTNYDKVGRQKLSWRWLDIQHHRQNWSQLVRREDPVKTQENDFFQLGQQVTMWKRQCQHLTIPIRTCLKYLPPLVEVNVTYDYDRSRFLTPSLTPTSQKMIVFPPTTWARQTEYHNHKCLRIFPSTISADSENLSSQHIPCRSPSTKTVVGWGRIIEPFLS